MAGEITVLFAMERVETSCPVYVHERRKQGKSIYPKAGMFMYIYKCMYTKMLYQKAVINKCLTKHSNKQCGVPSGSAATEMMIPASTITAVTLIVMTGLPIFIGW